MSVWDDVVGQSQTVRTLSHAAADSAAIVLLCAHQKQSLEVESIRVLKYPAGTDLASFPKAKPVPRTYPGREPDAPWRKAALERIESRMGANAPAPQEEIALVSAAPSPVVAPPMRASANSAAMSAIEALAQLSGQTQASLTA